MLLWMWGHVYIYIYIYIYIGVNIQIDLFSPYFLEIMFTLSVTLIYVKPVKCLAIVFNSYVRGITVERQYSCSVIILLHHASPKMMSAGAICQLWRLLSINCYIGRSL